MARHAEIAGGGMAGLSMGLMLVRSGWSVRLHERSTAIRESGAGIYMRRNSLKILQEFQLLEDLRPRGSRIERTFVFDAAGRVHQQRETPGELDLWVFPRQALIESIERKAREAGVDVRLESTAVAADPAGALILDDGARLEADGLITIVPHKGPIVTKVTVRQAESIYQVRGVLEGLAVRLFTVRASEAQLERLERAADTLERVYKKFEANAFLKAKSDFYGVLLEGADNEVATSMLRNIHIRVSLLRATSLSNPGRAKDSMKEIRQLLTAIRARDEEGAWKACMKHIENATKAALAVLREEQVSSD